MANIKITDLTSHTDPASTDVLPIVDVTNDETKKVSIADLMENAGAGTEALPGIAFDGDPNTGIYRPASDQLAISTGGTQRLLISGSVVTVAGDLTVNGTTTTVNSTTVTVDDKNIELGSVASPTDTTADGGGITLKGATDHTITWTNSTDSWDFSEHVNIASGKEFKINGTSVLSASTLGSGVTSSSLTSVGTITSGTWNGTALTANYIGTDAINGDKIADDSIDSEHYVDGSIDNAHLSTDCVNGDKIADNSIDNAHVTASAAIAGTKISPDFGSQNVSTTGDLAIDTDTLFADASSDRVGINTSTPAVSLDINATDAVALPHGTAAQRPSDGGTPANLTGYIRFNSDVSQFEGHNGTSWASVGGGATGGGSDQWAIEHDNTVTTSYTIGTGKNVISAGPITVQSGATITVPSGSNWSIV